MSHLQQEGALALGLPGLHRHLAQDPLQPAECLHSRRLNRGPVHHSPKRTLVIANPNAGGGSMPDDFTTRVEARRGFTVRLTERAGHARTLAAESLREGFETVVSAGGDGTLNEVVNGLEEGLHGTVRLGLLPLGTGNDFARTLGIPTALDAALDLLESEVERPCDVALLEGSQDRRLLLNMSAGGASGEVSDKIDTAIKRFWGPLAYLRAAVEVIPELSPYRLRLALDGNEPLELDVINLVVANARFIAAGIPIAPLAEIDDGLLDVIVFRACPLARLAVVTAQVVAGQHLDGSCPEAIFFRAREVELTCEPAMPFNADGELLEPQQVRFEILPGALRLAAPL